MYTALKQYNAMKREEMWIVSMSAWPIACSQLQVKGRAWMGGLVLVLVSMTDCGPDGTAAPARSLESDSAL